MTAIGGFTMKNVEIETKGDKLVITIDTTKEFGLSASGKTIIIASTGGNQDVVVNGKIVKVGLNVYRK